MEQAAVRAIAFIAMALPFQFGLGAWVLSCRLPDSAPRHRDGALHAAVVRRAARSLRRYATWSSVPAIPAALIVGRGLVGSGSTELESIVLILSIAIVGTIAACSAGLALDAGRMESMGRLRHARLQARLGGDGFALGVTLEIVACILGVVLIGGSSALRAFLSPTPQDLLALGSVLIAGCAAFAGILAGLSGKPRPGASLAVLGYGLAKAVFIIALF